MATSARLVGIGVFVLGGLLLFTLGLFMIGDRQMLFDTKVVIFTEFAKITGLQDGSIVRVSGAMAGALPLSRPVRDDASKASAANRLTSHAREGSGRSVLRNRQASSRSPSRRAQRWMPWRLS